MKSLIRFWKKYYFQLSASFLFPFFYYAPYLRVFGKGNERLYYYFIDELCLYVPQFMHSYFSSKNIIFSGIDFFTANGSSEFFLRPNIVTAYPIYFLISFLTNIRGIEGFFLLMLFIIFFHASIAMFFAQILAKKFFRFSTVASLFFAVFLVFSSKTMTAKQFPPFYYMVMLIPLLMYVSLSSLSIKNRISLFFISGVYVLMFLTGYIPLALASVVITIIFVSLYHIYINKKGYVKKSLPGLVRLFIPVGIASVVVGPFYFAILKYHKIASTMPADIKTIAHSVCLQLSDLLTIFSYGIFRIKEIEITTLYIGLIPIVAIFIYVFSNSNKGKLRSFQKRLIAIILPIVLISFLISFGDMFGLSSVFYSLVPGLGGMHLYARYMLITNVFFSLLVTILFSSALKKKDYRIGKVLIILSVILFLFLNIFIYLGNTASLHLIRFNTVLVEILFLMFFFIAYLKLSRKWIFYVGIVLIFILNTTYFYAYTDANHVYAKDYIYLHKDDEKGMINFIKTNSQKELIKYVNLMPNPRNVYIPRNYPWMVQKEIKLSNYLGYELHLASDLRYREKFPFYERINFEWLWKTGVDFVICDNKTYEKHKIYLDMFIDKNLNYKLYDGSRMYRLKPMTRSFKPNKYLFALETSSQKETILTITIHGKEYEVKTGPSSAFIKFNFTTEFDMDSIDLVIEKNSDEDVMIKNLYIRGYDLNNNIKYIPIALIEFDNNYTSLESLPDGWRRYLKNTKGTVRIKRTWNINEDTEKVFDNGIIKIVGDISNMTLNNFYTDYSKRVSFDVTVDKNPINIYYQLFPIKNIKVFINGKRFISEDTENLLNFTLHQGKYKILLKYSNGLLSFFNFMLLIYFTLYFVLILYYIKKNYIRGGSYVN
ncbi:hypothetical protein ACFL4A_00650 [bacterium]